MQVLKIILGIIIGIAALITMVEAFGEERGAGLGGAFIGFLLIGGLAFWLIKSGMEGMNKP